jgi:hypothetical protein
MQSIIDIMAPTFRLPVALTALPILTAERIEN